MATTKPKTKPEDPEVNATEPVMAENAQAKPIIAKNVDLPQYVIVRNGFQGQLIYQSPHTGEMFIWDSFGAEQEMELRELRNAKNASKSFFINNWFMFDEDWIVDYLGLRQYYKNSVKIDEFDELFSKPADELAEILKKIPAGQKHSLIYRAHELIASGDIDSRKTIATLENLLGVELIER